MSEQRTLATVVDEIPKQDMAIVRSGPEGILDTINNAVARGMSPEAIEKMFEVYTKMADRQAAGEFAIARAAFQADCPPIRRNRTGQLTREGNNTWDYADLDAILHTIRPHAARHGLTYHWNSAENGDAVTVTCVVSHVAGHSIESTCSDVISAEGAKMSHAQMMQKTRNYLKRQTLMNALGLSLGDGDLDDLPPRNMDPISETQQNDLRALAMDVGADEAQFLKFMKVKDWSEIPAAGYRSAVQALEEKRRRRGANK